MLQHRVGNRNAAHYNREYKSLFGLPPMRDVERLRGTPRESISLFYEWIQEYMITAQATPNLAFAQ